VSACSSSPILAGLDDLGPSADDLDTDPVSLLEALTKVADPRQRRGVRHGLAAVLAVGVCAVLAGARTFTAIAEWAHDLPAGVRIRLGLGRVVPSESTIRRVLQAIDAEVLDAVVSPLAGNASRPIHAGARRTAGDRDRRQDRPRRTRGRWSPRSPARGPGSHQRRGARSDRGRGKDQ
jgi:hypothetical protein